MEKIKNNLRAKFERAKREELDEKAVQENEVNSVLIPEKDTESTTYHKKKVITPKEAEEIKNDKNKLKNKFKHEHMDEINNIENQRKIYKPIIDGLSKVETAVKKVDEDIADRLPAIEFRKEPRGIVKKPEPKKIEFRKGVSDAVTQTQKSTNFGPIAAQYMAQLNDPMFGIRYSESSKAHKIGKDNITFEDDDIIIDDRRYKGTVGLWRLLTSVAPDEYSEDDLETYSEILNLTDALYQNNDRSKNKPRSSKSYKWVNLVSRIWEKSKHTGDGLLKYNENPVEFKYIHNLNELLKRLYYIHSQEQAGNNNFHNEKIGIINFFTDELESMVDSNKGTEYLIRFVSALPKGLIKEGSGIFNTVLNNLPFELHVPGYNYLGPGTKLEKRLARGDEGINKLDDAAKEHDQFYRDHKNTKERHLADKVLEYKAWDRVRAPDASIKEKSVAWLTTNAMKIKRHLGMGLKF